MVLVDKEPNESLVTRYLNRDIRVYLVSGTILSGRLIAVRNCEILVQDEYKDKQSLINLAHVISISPL
jgi:small nuclear ribonucleoprotein (snRNP)-like protein